MEPSKDWREVVAEGEHETFERYATVLADLQKARAKDGSPSRALHAKAHAGLRAELEVLADIPAYARVAVFAEPKTYSAYVRFSNGSGARTSDDKPDVRGLAIKLLDVPGKKLIPGMENETTQDFLLINTPALAFRTVEEFVSFVQVSSSPALLPFRLFGRLGFGAFGLLKRLIESARSITSLATETYFTVAPIRFGDYAARLSLAPRQTDVPPKTGTSLRDELTARLAKAPLVWDLRAQLYVNEDTTPIEDTSRAWMETDAPYVPLARLTIQTQDATSDDAKTTSDLVEKLAFDPWHACEELRPLGAAMRARSPAYRESQKTRKATPEPRS
jgi:hypothetical protein